MERLAAAALAVAFLALPASAIINPHDVNEPDRCRSCHTPEIYEAESGGEEYFLLSDSIDGVCLICHRKQDCCVIGQEHQQKIFIGQHTHPSDVDEDDVPKIHRPKSLPLFDDKITCSTCHEHNRREPVDYKLVRLVMVEKTGIDWTPLCNDCHDDY